MAGKIQYQVGFDVDKSSLNQLKSSLKELQNIKISDMMKINGSDTAKAVSDLAKIKTQAINVENALKQAFNAKLNTYNIETFNQTLKGSGSSINQVYQAFSKAGTAGQNAFRSLTSQVLSTNIQLKQSHNLLDKMATTLSNTVKWQAASTIVNAMARSIEQAWGYAKSLDTSLNNIRIVTGKSAEEMGKFAEQANAAAQSLGKTTTDYTNAALIYAQQGLNDEEIEKRTQITLKTANVTGQSTDQVSEQLTAVWNGYKVNAEEAELYVDRLAAVAATTASDLEELSTGMSKVASAAATMGVSEQQLAAQLSTIISATRESPETIGTSLRTVFARISDIKAGLDEEGVTLGNYSGKMAQLGFNVLDVNGNLRDMGQVLEEIGGRWTTLTREQQVNLAQTMAGQRQYSRLMALFDNFDKYQEALNTAQNAAGTLQEQQDIYMESTAAHLNTLKTSMENVYDSLIDTEGINGLIDGVSDAANVMASFIDSIGGGGNLLKSLGSIGMMVFSEQIAKGINTTITNLQIGKENARQFDQALQAVQEWQGIPGLDEMSQKLLANREQLLSLASLMNPEQFTGLQDMLNELTQATNKMADLNAQKEILEGAVSSLKKELKDPDLSLDKALGDGELQNKIIDEIAKQEQGFVSLSKTVKDYGKSLQQINSKRISGLDISKDLKTAKNELEGYIKELEILANKPGMEQHSEQIKKLRAEFDNLKNVPAEELAAKLQIVAGKIQGIAANGGQAAKNLRTGLEADFQGAAESVNIQVENMKNHVNGLADSFEISMGRMQRASSIEIFTRAVGSVTSLTMAIQNLQNLGNIWSNEDLAIGEKLLQTFTNLGMAVGMIIPAYQKLNAIYQAHSSVATIMGISMEKNTAAKLKDIIATGLQNKEDEKTIQQKVEEASLIAYNTGAIDKETVTKIRNAFATKGATAANESFKTSLMSNPFTAVAMAIMAIVAALGALIKAQDQARKAAIELDKANIEEENKKQEQIEKNKELCNSLDQLNEKYKNGETSRYELKSAVQDLIEQYGLEGAAAEKLANSYDNLEEYIKSTRKEMALAAQDSAKREISSAEDALVKEYAGNTLSVGGRWGRAFNENSKVAKIMQKSGFVQDQNSMYESAYKFADLNWKDPESIRQAWEAANQAITEMQQTLSASERSSDPVYQDLVKWKDELAEEVDLLKAGKQDLIKSSTEVAATEVDLSNIENVNQYYERRKQLIQEIQKELDKNNDKTADAEAMADAYLAENARNIYSAYDDASKFLDKFKGENETVMQAFSNLDEEHIFAVMDAAQYTTDWNQLADIIERIGNADLSNVGNAFGKNLDAMKAAASQIYTTFQSLYDKAEKGQGLSSEEFQGLSDQLKQFYGETADGTYKMTGDFVEFANKVNNLKFDGFKQNITELTNSRNGLLNLQKEQSIAERKNLAPINPDQLGDENTGVAETMGTLTDTGPMQAIVGYTKEINQQRLHYLELVNQGTVAEQNQIQAWKEKNAQGQLTIQQQQQILTRVQELDDITKELTIEQLNQEIFENEMAIARSVDSFKELKQLAEEGTISDKAFDQASLEMHQSERMQGLDLSAVDEYGDFLQELAESEEEAYIGSEKLSKDLIDNAEAADDLAVQIQRMNKGVKTLADNWDDWSDVLRHSSKGSDEYYEASEGVKDALSDLLDISSDYISLDLVDKLAQNADGMDLMARAAQGDGEAIDQLRQVALEDIVMHMQLDDSALINDNSQLLSRVQQLQDMLDEMPIEITPGMDLSAMDQGGAAFIDALNQLIYDAGMSADQVNTMLSGMGFTANYASEPQTIKYKDPDKTIQHVRKVSKGTSKSPQGDEVEEYDIETTTEVIPGKERTGSIDAASLQTSEPGTTVVPKINSLTKMAGGGANNYSSSNSAPSSGGGKGSGGGGGGGGSGSKPDTSQKDLKEQIKETVDIYHDVNIRLQQIDTTLNRLQKTQSKLFGRDLINNLNQQAALLEKQKKTLQEKYEIQKKDLAQRREELQGMGVTFDENGDISNYLKIIKQKQDAVNASIARENELIKKYNEQTDADIKKSISEELDVLSKQTQKVQKELDKLADGIKEYDELKNSKMQDVIDSINEATQRQVEIKIQQFNMQVEIRLELGEAERDWNKFRREVLERPNILRDNEAATILADTRQNVRDAISYFETNVGEGEFATLPQHIMDIRKEIEDIDSKGQSDIYGNNKRQALMENLKGYLDQLMSKMEDYEQLLEDIDQAYLDMIDTNKDLFDEQIESYEFVGELIEHDIDLLTLLYGDKNYEAMNNYYSTLQENNLNQLESLRLQSEYWQREWQDAVARGDSQAAKKLEKNYKDTISKLNSVVEESAQNLRDKYSNAINQIFDDLGKQITGGQGLDYTSLEWDLVNKNSDEYLDTVNRGFAIQDIAAKYQKAIDNTSSIKGQRQLNKLMEEQVGFLKDKEKLTQYDVDRAEKLLQVEQARIALEDAQAAKTSMRLKRDSQGNYSYEYVADDAATNDAAQELANAQQDLYNFDKEAYRANLDDQLAMWKEFQDQYKEILLDTSYTEEERAAALTLLKEQYGEYLNNKTEENYVIRANFSDSYYDSLAALYDENLENYSWMSDAERDKMIANLEEKKAAYKDSLGGQLDDFRFYRQEYDTIVNSDKTEEQKEKALNKLKEDLDAVKIGNLEEYRKKYDDIINSDKTEEQKEKALDKLKRDYTSDQTTRAEEATKAREGFEESAKNIIAGYYTDNEENFKNMIENEKSAVNDPVSGLVPTWNTGIQSMTNAMTGAGGFLTLTAKAFEEVRKKTIEYQKSVKDMADAAGLNIGDLKAGVDALAKALKTTIIDSDTLLNRVKKQTDAIKELKKQIKEVTVAYKDVYQYAKNAVSETNDYIKVQEQLAAEMARLAKEDLLKQQQQQKAAEEPKKQETPKQSSNPQPKASSSSATTWDRVKEVYDLINTGAVGYGANRVQNLQSKGYTNDEIAKGQQAINLAYNQGMNFEEIRKALGLATGGYTGQWGDNSGKLAFLHEKELVLNKQDTSNLLDAVNILRTITSSLDKIALGKLGSINNNSLMNLLGGSAASEIQQSVQIEASFPNVNSKKEIEEALNDLVNLAAQRAMR